MEARLYDGVTGHPHAVSVAFDAGGIRLSQPGGWSEEVDAGQLRRMDGSRDELRLARKDQQGWRLILPHEAQPEVHALLGKEDRYGRWIDRVGLVPALVIGAVITVAVVGFGYVAPHWIAPHVPMSWERNVGGAIVGDFGDLRCRNPQGQKALETLVERVAPGATKGPDGIKVAALDVNVFNAAALPGGYVVVFKPAVTETNPDALAGILAHEVAHVRRRHVTEALLRELGIGALIRMFAGDLGANAEQLVSLSYTRANEAQADSDAIQMLQRAGVSPNPTAELFERLSKEAPAFSAQFLQSHPASARRAQRFAASFDRNAHYRPALDSASWNALLNMCPEKPKG
jgi:Zn-dependent protease with chaperone function